MRPMTIRHPTCCCAIITFRFQRAPLWCQVSDSWTTTPRQANPGRAGSATLLPEPTAGVPPPLPPGLGARRAAPRRRTSRNVGPAADPTCWTTARPRRPDHHRASWPQPDSHPRPRHRAKFPSAFRGPEVGERCQTGA